MIYLSISKNIKYFSVDAQCKTLNISRNAYYNYLNNFNKKLEKRAKRFVKILEIYWDSKGTYGSPRITVELVRNGFNVSQSTVSKDMRLLGIESVHTAKFPSRKSSMTPEEKILIKNLILHLDITHPNQVWTTDITYINTKYDGTLYLISFIDLFSRKVVGWHLGRNQKTSSILIALNRALKTRKPLPGLIIHSDKGSQFRSHVYRNFLVENHFLFSYTELDHSCDQNAAQESFHATLKKEWLSTRPLYYYEDSYRTIFEFIEGFYNPKRLHSSLGYLSPISFENNYLSSKIFS